LGPDAQQRYSIIIDDPSLVADKIYTATQEVEEQRQSLGEAFHFNWQLHIEDAFQQPFMPTHKNMAALNLKQNQAANQMAANLRCAMSGIVAGNVKQFGIEQVRHNGPYRLQAETELMRKLDTLLQSFVEQQRMKLPSSKDYVPCYTVE
jgi:hypothetical protein